MDSKNSESSVNWIFWRVVLCSGRVYVVPCDQNKTQIAGEYLLPVFLNRKPSGSWVTSR